MKRSKVGMETKEESDVHEYPQFQIMIQDSLNQAVLSGESFFKTDTKGLFRVFLEGLPLEHRQHYNCNCCKEFIRKFGDLVRVDRGGRQLPVMWNITHTPEFFKRSVTNMCWKIVKSEILGMFFYPSRTFGTPHSNGWSHMHGELYQAYPPIDPGTLYSSFEKYSQKLEEFKMAKAAIIAYDRKTAKTALTLIETRSIPGEGKFSKPIRKFIELHNLHTNIKDVRRRDRMIWKWISKVPQGFAHIGTSSSVIASLFDDIIAGYPINKVSQRFSDKIGHKYMRPTSAPASGNIDQAEKIVQKLEIKTSLKRRFATFDEVFKIWAPTKEEYVDTGGVFGSIRPKAKSQEIIYSDHNRNITWRDFKKDVLPQTDSIKLQLGSYRQSFSAMVTATDPIAPLIFKWSNPVSTYLYIHGSTPDEWNIRSGKNEVAGICEHPSMWDSTKTVSGYEGIMLLIKGARDTRFRDAGLGLFPSTLKSELHSIRKTIEAYSSSNVISGFSNSSACGLFISKSNFRKIKVNVVISGVSVQYTIDRW